MQITPFSTNKTLNAAGRIVDLSTPKIMAILNVTPDSFFDGGKYNDEESIVSKAAAAVRDGATFIDVGGYSSRPGARDISTEEELARVIPAIKLVARNFPQLIISIDTFRSEVAKAAADSGAVMVNDISGGSLDKNMYAAVAGLKLPYVLMHMKGTPQTMMREAVYENVVADVINYFKWKIEALVQQGLYDVVIDPGFGFAKTRDHNFQLLNQLELLGITGRPLLVGLSRKSMVWKTLEVTAEEALNGTTVLNTIALLKGVSILRVHDAKEAQQAIVLTSALGRQPQ